MATFENPMNGYTETVSERSAFWYTLLFGCFYLAYRGAYKHAVIAAAAAFFTAGLSWLVYPWFAYNAIAQSYLQRGWRELPVRAAFKR